MTYQIVGDDEADIKLGLISVSSPIARALIGRAARRRRRRRAPGGSSATRSSRCATSGGGRSGGASAFFRRIAACAGIWTGAAVHRRQSRRRRRCRARLRRRQAAGSDGCSPQTCSASCSPCCCTSQARRLARDAGVRAGFGAGAGCCCGRGAVLHRGRLLRAAADDRGRPDRPGRFFVRSAARRVDGVLRDQTLVVLSLAWRPHAAVRASRPASARPGCAWCAWSPRFRFSPARLLRLVALCVPALILAAGGDRRWLPSTFDLL